VTFWRCLLTVAEKLVHSRVTDQKPKNSFYCSKIMTADAWKMILRSSKAQFIALSESGKLRKSSTGIEPYLNHGVRVQLDINKLQKVHRKVVFTT
jgi:hypothetical protein